MIAPVDVNRCQAEKPNGATFMSMGGVPELIRCKDKPTVIVVENEADKDGLKGSMSLCDHCLSVAKTQLPENFFHVISIKSEESDE